MTEFRIGVDWRRKGYICRDARPGDPLNVLPTPITYAAINYTTFQNSVVSRNRAQTRYGATLYDIQTGNSSWAGIRIGIESNGTVETIPVQAGQPYKLRFYVRGLTNYETVALNMVLFNQLNDRQTGMWNQLLSDTWTAYELTFTPTANTEYIYLRINKHQTTTDARFQVTGLMLVEGNTMPAAHNMGREIDLYDDITDRVISANWFIGMRQAYQDVADDSMLKLELDNSDRRFSPEYRDSPLNETFTATVGNATQTITTNHRMPFRPVDVLSRRIAPETGQSVEQVHYRGWIESIQPGVNRHGKRRATLTCAGPMLFFKRVDADIELQQDQRTDQIINRLLDEVPLPSGLAERPVIGDPLSQVGHVIVPDITLPRVLQTGQTTLHYAADNWSQSVSGRPDDRRSFNVYQAIQDTTAAERGRFLFDRTGRAVFWNRHFLIQQSRPDALPVVIDHVDDEVFDSHITDMDYEYAGLDEFINDVRVTCHPRTLSADDNVLLHELVYDRNNPEPGIIVAPGDEKVITISFQDADTSRVGALNARLTYIRWSGGVAVDWQEEGESGTNFLTVPPGTLQLDATASGARLRVRAGETYVHLLAYEVRGQAIYDNGPIEAVAENQHSITQYGRRSRRMNIAALDQPGFAQNIADFEIHRRSTPRGAIRQMTLRSHTIDDNGRHIEQLQHTPGTLVEVHEAQTGHRGKYVIIGEAHRLSDSGTLLESTWYLEPLPVARWAIAEPASNDVPDGEKPAPGVTVPTGSYRVAY